MTTPIRFDGQVAIVTGGGGGLGRAFALALAERGARVVVNDYGGDMFGSGGAAAPAATVAAEIRAPGGEAIAQDAAVGEADAARRIVADAMAAFGRVDILVNNAGISAPGPLNTPTDARAEQVFRTNLIGPYHLIRAAWPVMSAQGTGRILNIASNAVLGHPNSAPYAASKAGLIGLTLGCAVEGAPLGIRANALMPTAYSRMIEAAPDKDFIAWMKAKMPAEKAVAAALWLLHPDADVSGGVFSAGGGRLARVSFYGAPGMFEAEITPEDVRERMDEVMAMDGAVRIEDRTTEVGLNPAF